jgi:hypothetical protein
MNSIISKVANGAAGQAQAGLLQARGHNGRRHSHHTRPAGLHVKASAYLPEAIISTPTSNANSLSFVRVGLDALLTFRSMNQKNYRVLQVILLYFSTFNAGSFYLY